MRRASRLLPRKSYSSQPSRPNCWRADWIFGRSNILFEPRSPIAALGIVLEADGAGVHLAAGAGGQRLIQLRAGGFDPAEAGAAVAQAGVEVGDDQVVLDRFR